MNCYVISFTLNSILLTYVCPCLSAEETVKNSKLSKILVFTYFLRNKIDKLIHKSTIIDTLTSTVSIPGSTQNNHPIEWSIIIFISYIESITIIVDRYVSIIIALIVAIRIIIHFGFVTILPCKILIHTNKNRCLSLIDPPLGAMDPLCPS